MVTFLRRDAARFAKFGYGRGKKAKWRSPKGRDNKMREKRKGYAATVSIGYGKPIERTPLMINNVKDLIKATKEDVLILSKVGVKKKIEIINKASELGLKFKNENIESFLKKVNKKEKKEWL